MREMRGVLFRAGAYFRALAGVTVLYESWAKHFTLTVPPSSQDRRIVRELDKNAERYLGRANVPSKGNVDGL